MTEYFKCVGDGTPTGSINVPMTPEEVAEHLAQQEILSSREVEQEKDEARRQALAEKWPDAFAIVDDILNRGAEVVKAERDAIKLENPKGVELIKGE